MSELQKSLSGGLQARAYQQRAHGSLNYLWAHGARSVVLVSPTGSGKTLMLARQVNDAIERRERVLWLVHTRDLVEQAVRDVGAIVGRDRIGVIMSGHVGHAERLVQVASIQTMIERDVQVAADLVVFDECHHAEAETYKHLVERLRPRALLGGTATPERRDGKALGDMFEHMVVAAQYSELIRDQYLVPAYVLRPPSYLGSDLAMDPAEACARYCMGMKTFLFGRRVAEVSAYCKQIGRLGMRAESIDATTADVRRGDVLTSFRHGSLSVIGNVYVLTEGVDVPAASACVIARSFSFSGTMLQATGRVLRPSSDKTRALIVDLSGCTHRHGWPDDDREYSLQGKAIAAKSEDREFAHRSENVDPQVLGIGLRLQSKWAPSPVPSDDIEWNSWGVRAKERRAERAGARRSRRQILAEEALRGQG